MKSNSRNVSLDPLWPMLALFVMVMSFALQPQSFGAQINSGSTGVDGDLRFSGDRTIDMKDHPTGIYHYKSIIIPYVTVRFIPNAQNTPVVWLVQGDCEIYGEINLDGEPTVSTLGAKAGPGGFKGGDVGRDPQPGLGLGGGTAGPAVLYAGHGSFGTVGVSDNTRYAPGPVYGNQYLLPLVGGSGGGGPGGGGGGAILIVANGTILLNGYIRSRGGWATSTQLRSEQINGINYHSGGGAGSGGAIRLVCTSLVGTGGLDVSGGRDSESRLSGGQGRIRIDTLRDAFSGQTLGLTTRGFQPVIMLPPDQGIELRVLSVAGIPISPTPQGLATSPDVVISGEQPNPISIVVACKNIPLNSPVTVEVKSANGSAIRTVGSNNGGTLASSTATVSINMPKGGGTIQASAVSGIKIASGVTSSLVTAGFSATDGSFTKTRVTTDASGHQEIEYITENGTVVRIPQPQPR